MQNTRLNNLLDVLFGRLGRSLRNPWRRLSLITISLLFGVFLGTAIPTTSGQRAAWDIVAAGILIVFTEAVSWFVYGSKRANTDAARLSTTIEGELTRIDLSPRSLSTQMLNALKIGLTYSLFIEAFKLGS